MRSVFPSILIIFSISLSLLVHSAEHKQLRMHYFEREIPSLAGETYSVVKDKNGYYWIGSSSGLLRYDGADTIHFFNEDSDPLYEKIINRMVIRKNELWMGLIEGGIARLDLENYRVNYYPFDASSSMVDSGVVAMSLDQYQNLWVGTDKSLYRLNPDVSDVDLSIDGSTKKRSLAKDFRRFSLAATQDPLRPHYKGFREAAIDGKGRAWVVTMEQGLQLLDIDAGKFSSIADVVSEAPGVIQLLDGGSDVRSVVSDGSDRMLVLHKNHLFRFSTNGELLDRVDFSSEPLGLMPIALGMTLSGGGDVWVRTQNADIININSDFSTVNYGVDALTDSSRSAELQTDLFLDERGEMIVTNFHGYPKFWNLAYLHSESKRSLEHLPELQALTAYYPRSSGSGFWVNMGGSYLVKLDASLEVENIIEHEVGPKDFEEAWGRIWLASNDGLFHIGLNGEGLGKYTDLYGTEIFYSKVSGLWIRGVKGLDRISHLGAEVKHYDVHPNFSAFSSYVYKSKDGKIWAVSENSLHLYDPVSDKFSEVDSGNLNGGLSLGRGIAIENGKIYSVGKKFFSADLITQEQSYKLDNVKVYKNFRAIPAVYEVVHTGAGLWYSNDIGSQLGYFSLASEQFKIFDVEDGFPWQRGAKLFGSINEDQLLFSHGSELIRVELSDAMLAQQDRYRIHSVTTVDDNAKETQRLRYQSGVELAPQDKVLIVRFGNFSSAKPTKNRLRYRLIGMDSSWIDSISDHAIFSGLKPGSYQFQLQDWAGKGEVEVLNLTVRTYWWASDWFYVGLASLFFSLSAALIYLRLDSAKVRAQADKAVLLYSEGFERVDQGIAVFSKNGELISRNRAFQKFCVSENSSLGCHYSVCFGEGPGLRVFREAWECLPGQGFWQGRLEITRENDTLFVECRASQLMVENAGAYMLLLSDVSESVRHKERLHQMTVTDSLTSLPNRHSVEKEVRDRIFDVGRNGGGFILYFIGLDRFKNINDSLGYFAGDQLLRRIASRLKSVIRQGEFLARLDGDVFVLLSKLQSETQLIDDLVGRVLAQVEAPFLIGGRDLFVSLSLGAVSCPKQADSLTGLLRMADISMVAAKEQAGSGFSFYDHAMDQKPLNRVTLESELHAAIIQDEFEVYLQPKITLLTGRLSGFEALLRWRSPRRGLTFPGSFIQIAEDTGLIVKIGQIVLDKTCVQISQWRSAGLEAVPVAINVSPQQFVNESFSDEVLKKIRHYNIPNRLIEFEVTETMLMKNMHSVVRQLSAFREHGHRISVDDFGTGYSSLSYLTRLPIDVLKIDQSFVKDLHLDKSKMAVVKTILQLAKNLNLSTVAEGIDSIDSHQYLLSAGCTHGQGFLYNKALAPDSPELLKLIASPVLELEA